MGNDIKLKEPKTFEQQIDILEARGIRIEDRESAKRILSMINYYRLTAYELQFKLENIYIGDIKFDTLYKLYNFDKKMKNLIIGALESIEISIIFISYIFESKIIFTIIMHLVRFKFSSFSNHFIN